MGKASRDGSRAASAHPGCVFNNTDYPDWHTARRALADDITHRNARD
jgi:hypothetical protein